MGLSNFDVLVDSIDVQKMQAALHYQQKEQEKALEHKRLTQMVGDSVKKSLSIEEGGTQEKIGSYMMATVSPCHEDPNRICGIDDRLGKLELKQTINQLEAKETRLIKGLYQTHFAKKNDKNAINSHQTNTLELSNEQEISNHSIENSQKPSGLNSGIQ